MPAPVTRPTPLPTDVPQPLCFGEFTVDATRMQLRRGDAEVPLRPKSFQLLCHLAGQAGTVVDRDELYALLWPKVVVTEESLTRCISDVRAALGDADHRLIRTVARRGYMLAAEVTRADAAPPAPPLATAVSAAFAPRTNLPDALAALIGRDDDLAGLLALLASQRLVSLVGAGGVGKSVLARGLLKRCAEAFEHGVCWVDLTVLTDPAGLAAVVTGALGVSVGGGDVRAALLNTLRPLRLVLALDNAEHLVDGVADLARAIHDEAPGVHLLVTSQVPLGLAAERVYRLDPLPLPAPDADADAVRASPAVALFVARAQASDARFVLADAQLPTAVEVCRRLDGLPLAIELAACQAPWLGLPRLAQALDERFRALGAVRRDLPARQATLTAAMQWSHALLGESEQTVFRRLGVFVGSFPLELAQRVAADDTLDEWAVLHAIGTLVDRSLLASTGGDEPRLRLLETPRAFALSLLPPDEAAAVRLRHARAWQAHFARAYQDYLSGRDTVDRWRDRLWPDLDDGRAALRHAREVDPALAVALAADLAFVLTGEAPAERRQVLDGTRALAESDVPPLVRARWSQETAFCLAELQPAVAREHALAAAAVFRSHGQAWELYRTLGILVYCELPGEAGTTAAELAEMQAVEDPAWPAVLRAQHTSASACWHSARGDFAAAVLWNRRNLELNARAGSTWRRLIAQSNMLNSLVAADRLDEAVDCGQDLLRRLQGTRWVASLPGAHLNLAAAMLACGDTTAARALAVGSLAHARPIGWLVYWGDYLALLAVQEGRARDAAELLGWTDATYARNGVEREVNEAAARERAWQALQPMLPGPALFEALAAGARRDDDDVPRLAFGA